MIDFTITTEIARPPEVVFAYATDPARLATWQTNTISAELESDGPMGQGARLREVHRGPFGKRFSELVEVVRYEPDAAFDLHVIEGPPIDAEIRFEPQGGGTRMHFRVHGQPSGLLRLMEPLAVMGLRRNFAQYCATLKAVLESQPL
jgi:uncharacterized protein YndB with AHSA1/START domain